MPLATTADVLTRVQRRLKSDVRRAAGDNNLVSKVEQERLPDALLKDTATDIRAAGGRGARVKGSDIVERAYAQIEGLLAAANPGGARDAALVSADEVRTALEMHPLVGARIAKAYELITGKRITLPAVVEPPVEPPVGLSAARIATIEGHALSVARMNDMNNGEIPTDRRFLAVPVLRDGRVGDGRTYTVHIPLPIGTLNSDGEELMWLHSIAPPDFAADGPDAVGVQRTTTFAVPAMLAGDDG